MINVMSSRAAPANEILAITIRIIKWRIICLENMAFSWVRLRYMISFPTTKARQGSGTWSGVSGTVQQQQIMRQQRSQKFCFARYASRVHPMESKLFIALNSIDHPEDAVAGFKRADDIALEQPAAEDADIEHSRPSAKFRLIQVSHHSLN